VGFNLSSSALSIVWGSPNNDNTVTFYSLANGQGTAHSVTTDDLVANFPVGNNLDPGGYFINFGMAGGFESVVFSTGATAFEFAFTASPDQQITPVPEPSTWAMMILGFAGVGFMAYRRKSNGPALRIV
jgi:hypothetical protein